MHRPTQNRAIRVCALADLEPTTRAAKASHVLSLLSPGFVLPWTQSGPPRAHAHLTFHDMTRPVADMPEAILPDRDHVAAIVAFGRRWHTEGEGPLIVHCFAGISRSTAAAYIIACALLPRANEAELAGRLRTASVTARPNQLLIAHADLLLERDGRMIDAVDDMPMAAFAPQCRPFNLELAEI